MNQLKDDYADDYNNYLKVTKGHHQLHHHNQLDVDAPSSSLMDLPPLSSSLVGNDSTISNSAQREFDSDGIEIVRFHQVAQVEHHRPSASWSSSGGEEVTSSGGCNLSLTPQHHGRTTNPVGPSKSSCSAHRGSSDSNSSGSMVRDEEVFHYEGRPHRLPHRSLHCQQSSKQSPANKQSVGSGGTGSNGSTSDGKGSRYQTKKESISRSNSSHASVECLDVIDPSKHAQDLRTAFLTNPVASGRPPFLLPSSTGDRALAMASELEPLSGHVDDDYERGSDEGGTKDYRLSGVLLTKFPMETGL